MTYINVGAYVNGARPKSKKALKEALRDGQEVVFDKTAAFFDGEGSFTSETIPPGVTLSVVGPDPYHRRMWYGSVVVKNGKVVCS